MLDYDYFERRGVKVVETKIRKTYHFGGYIQRVHYLLESKDIYFIDCECQDFHHRRMYKNGLFSDQRIFAKPCKHLQPIITIAESEGLTLRTPKPMIGTDRCTAELRRFLIERSFGICEVTGCKAKGDEVHRKVPRTNQGKYNKTNCVLLCKPHHQAITFQKWQGTPGAKK